MFGQNQIAPLVNKEGDTGASLEVNSIFYTIQGEGPFAGCPAVFVRLAGCNLKCHFCDTEFEQSRTMTVDEIIAEVKRINENNATDLVVLTGGEPMRQQIIPLIAALDDFGYHTQIETAGTVWPAEVKMTEYSKLYGDLCGTTLESYINARAVDLVCSPKTKKLHPMVETLCQHFKYIIRKGETSALDGLPLMSTQVAGHKAELFRPDDAIATIWVQPCAEYGGADNIFNPVATMQNTDECVRIAMWYGYRLSLQLHKIVGLE